MERDFKGVFIPKVVWLDPELTVVEKVLLTEIDSLDHGDGCFAGNDHLANFVGLSGNRVAHIISSLRKRGYIEDVRFDGKKRWIRAKTAMSKTTKQPCRKRQHRYNNIINNTESNKVISKDITYETDVSATKVEEKEKPKKTPKKIETPEWQRKTTLISYLEGKTGLKIRGQDGATARGMISLMWKLGFTDKHIEEAIDWWAAKIPVDRLTFPFLYRNIERWEKANENVVVSEVKRKE